MEHYLGVLFTFCVVFMLIQEQVKTGKRMLHYYLVVDYISDQLFS